MERKVYVIIEYLDGDDLGFPVMVYPDKKSADDMAAKWNEGSKDIYTVAEVNYCG